MQVTIKLYRTHNASYLCTVPCKVPALCSGASSAKGNSRYLLLSDAEPEPVGSRACSGTGFGFEEECRRQGAGPRVHRGGDTEVWA